MFIVALLASASMAAAEDTNRFSARAPEIENARSSAAGWGYDSGRGFWSRTDVYAYRSTSGEWLPILRREEADRAEPRWAEPATCPAVLAILDEMRNLEVGLHVDIPNRGWETSDPSQSYIWAPSDEGSDFVRLYASSGPLRAFTGGAERGLADCWKDERPF
ncbi:hypothetical protein [Brevundimonas sp. Root1279]|uniref:hypothetical protein n=1 Tax=Brevundimonas sp. Root1279 TaxID=1736443 RepID=UPI0006F6A479|nr:hypothetical protein [Brevundimonas sp. Root1279]KQW83754.1 hypothetical protein ASC65_03665 [Brevundimonas sp. Root1279]